MASQPEECMSTTLKTYYFAATREDDMAKDEDDTPRPRPKFEIGQPLDLLSVQEIEETLAELREEIAQLEATRAAKQSASAAAEAFFKK